MGVTDSKEKEFLMFRGSLEEEIQQYEFRSEYQRAALNLMLTHNWFKTVMQQLLKPFGVTMQQYNVLRILRGMNPKPITTAEIRDRMLDKMSDSSRIVIRLYDKGLVEKKVNKSDKRLVDVTISTKGLKLLEEMDVFERKMDYEFQGLTKEESIQFNQLCEKLRKGPDCQ
ncbi:MAG: MarR family transcriptional regulator [Bacteroidota bacterium]